jgi:hypothetical protein
MFFFLLKNEYNDWKKWISSSTSWLSHLSQILSFKGIIGLVYLPTYIFNLWELILNFVIYLLFLYSFIISRYFSNPKFVLICTYVLNFPFSFISWFQRLYQVLIWLFFNSVFTVCLREDIEHDLYLLPPGVFKTLNILERAENHDWPPSSCDFFESK